MLERLRKRNRAESGPSGQGASGKRPSGRDGDQGDHAAGDRECSFLLGVHWCVVARLERKSDMS